MQVLLQPLPLLLRPARETMRVILSAHLAQSHYSTGREKEAGQRGWLSCTTAEPLKLGVSDFTPHLRFFHRHAVNAMGKLKNVTSYGLRVPTSWERTIRQ